MTLTEEESDLLVDAIQESLNEDSIKIIPYDAFNKIVIEARLPMGTVIHRAIFDRGNIWGLINDPNKFVVKIQEYLAIQ